MAKKVALTYLVATTLWILLSDRLVAALFGHDQQLLEMAQTVKGMGFVLVMTGLLFVLVKRMNRLEDRFKQMESMLAVSEKLEVVGSFAATTAHDLNNMLMVVRGMTELAKLDQQSGEPLPPARLEEIEGAVVRASELVRQLSAFVRGSGEELTETEAGVLLRSFNPLLQQAASKHLVLEFSVPKQLGTICVNPSALEQVLLNLLVNARDALAGRAGGQVKLTAERCELDQHMSVFCGRPRSGEFVKISVRDNGPGIPPDQRVQVFEPFFTTKQPGQGTGLGLASVMRTMQQHDGWVELDSEVGVGCHFALFFPVVEVGETAAVA